MSMLFNRGFYHNDLNNGGNLLVKLDNKEVSEVRLIDFDRSVPIDAFPAEHNVPQTSYDFYVPREVNDEFLQNYGKNFNDIINDYSIKDAYVNKITEATSLFKCLKGILPSDTSPKVLNDIKKAIFEEYLFNINLQDYKKNNNIVKDKIKVYQTLNALLDNALLTKENTIFLESRRDLKTFKQKLSQREGLITHLQDDRVFKDILPKYTIVLPHKTLGFTSSSRVDVVILNSNGEELANKVYSIDSDEFYDQGLFGRYGRRIFKDYQKSKDFFNDLNIRQCSVGDNALPSSELLNAQSKSQGNLNELTQSKSQDNLNTRDRPEKCV